jgi:hypothetical protein
LDVQFGYGGGFVIHANYSDQSIDTDEHRTTDYSGWVYAASSADGGQTWEDAGGGVDTEPLGDGQIEALNWNPGDWTFDNFDIPVPEPCSASLLMIGAALTLRRKH